MALLIWFQTEAVCVKFAFSAALILNVGNRRISRTYFVHKREKKNIAHVHDLTIYECSPKVAPPSPLHHVPPLHRPASSSNLTHTHIYIHLRMQRKTPHTRFIRSVSTVVYLSTSISSFIVEEEIRQEVDPCIYNR